MTKERFELRMNDKGQVDIIDWLESMQKDAICIYNDLGVFPYSSAEALCDLLNELVEENEKLKRTISKIDFAIIRKYDNSLENLLDEVYDSEYNKWIKKQLSRAKKLDGDVE